MTRSISAALIISIWGFDDAPLALNFIQEPFSFTDDAARLASEVLKVITELVLVGGHRVIEENALVTNPYERKLLVTQKLESGRSARGFVKAIVTCTMPQSEPDRCNAKEASDDN